MAADLRVLVLLDEQPNEQGDRALAYAARVLAPQPAVELHLLLVLPPTPSEFLEFGSIEDMEEQRAAAAAHRGAQVEWMDATLAAVHPCIAHARQLLENAAISPASIHEHCEPSVHTRHVAQHAMDCAEQYGCDTIILSHAHAAWYERLLHKDPSGELLRRGTGRVIWFVG